VPELPLSGRRIVVTRPREHARALVARLEALGAEAPIVPLIAIEPLEDGGELARLVERDEHDWIVFTSANAVAAVGALLGGVSARFAAVGTATAAALREYAVEASFVPGRFAALEIAAGLEPLGDARVLLPQSEIAEPLLADELRARGAVVDVVEAYRTVPRRPSPDELATLRAGDAVVLMSGSAARSLAAAGVPGHALLVCIGPRTAAVAAEVGLRVGLVADEATADGIIRTLVAHFGEST
jgi:uroporphyrinogen-III synthase